MNPYFKTQTGDDVGGLVRLNADGSLDATFHSAISHVRFVAVQPDEEILVSSGDPPAVRLDRLNADGTRDGTFHFGSGFVALNWTLLPDGKIIAWGSRDPFFNDGRLSRYHSDGSWELDYKTPEPLLSDGRAYWASPFPQIVIDQRGRIVLFAFGLRDQLIRLNADGSADQSFAVDFGEGYPSALVLEPDGNLIVSGKFNSVNGLPRPGIVRVFSEP